MELRNTVHVFQLKTYSRDSISERKKSEYLLASFPA